MSGMDTYLFQAAYVNHFLKRITMHDLTNG